MTLYHWSTCPPQVRTEVRGFVDAAAAFLGTQLVSTYLHGSLAMASFNLFRSDVDLLILIDGPVQPAERAQLARTALSFSGTPSPLEFSVLDRQQLEPWTHPAPFEFHYSEDWRRRYEELLATGDVRRWAGVSATDVDLAAHITVTRERGIVLSGPGPEEVLPAVPQRDYVHAIVSDLVWAGHRVESNPVYFVLNACRVYAYLVEERVLSKTEAARWAIDMLPASYIGLVDGARATYQDAENENRLGERELGEFGAFITREVQRLTAPYHGVAGLLALMDRYQAKDG